MGPPWVSGVNSWLTRPKQTKFLAIVVSEVIDNSLVDPQVELNKKRENELQKIRRDMEEQQIQNEQTVSSLRKKQQDAVNELTDQLDQLSKVKAK